MSYKSAVTPTTNKVAVDNGRTWPEANAEKASFIYLPSLDGLRAVSILLVMVSHAGLYWIVPGGLGVIVFFVISGFLLTRQMIAEIERSGTLNIRNFYMRRFFRLAPVLLIYMLAFNVILLQFGAEISLGSILSGLFYFTNYFECFMHVDSRWNPNTILWSLAVEEHFYLIFPLLMFSFRRNLSTLILILCSVVCCIFIWRVFLYSACSTSPGLAVCGIPDSERIFHATDSVIDCIAYGAITALSLHYYTDNVRRVLFNRTALFLSVTTLLVTLLIRESVFRDTIRFSLQSICISVIILNILFCRSGEYIRHALSIGFVILIGRLSYSLYLFHFGVLMLIVAVFGFSKFPPRIDIIGFYVVGSFSCASMAYWFVEKPMVRLRRRIGARTAEG